MIFMDLTVMYACFLLCIFTIPCLCDIIFPVKSIHSVFIVPL